MIMGIPKGGYIGEKYRKSNSRTQFLQDGIPMCTEFQPIVPEKSKTGTEFQQDRFPTWAELQFELQLKYEQEH